MLLAEDKVITGNEQPHGNGSALDALIAFYRAFNGRDLTGMRQVWADGGGGLEPSMSNPIGGLRRGWSDIAAGYQSLFESSARVTVEFHDYTTQERGGWCLFVGRERGWCVTADSRLELAIRTSRLFMQIEDRWRQIHHHGSFEKGVLLSAYQLAILGKAQ
jgi:hypothetical protein